MKSANRRAKAAAQILGLDRDPTAPFPDLDLDAVEPIAGHRLADAFGIDEPFRDAQRQRVVVGAGYP